MFVDPKYIATSLYCQANDILTVVVSDRKLSWTNYVKFLYRFHCVFCIIGIIVDGADGTNTGMLGKDIDVTLDVTTVTVQFEGFESADQGIMGYEWAVGTTPGGEELQGYTKQGIVLKEEMSVAGNGNFFYY